MNNKITSKKNTHNNNNINNVPSRHILNTMFYLLTPLYVYAYPKHAVLLIKASRLHHLGMLFHSGSFQFPPFSASGPSEEGGQRERSKRQPE